LELDFQIGIDACGAQTLRKETGRQLLAEILVSVVRSRLL
jgi:hypothetical protein